MIEIRLLEELVSFANNGTLSAAAEELHTSQPALTRSMKKLEEELDVTLFNRGKNRLELNETGKVAAEYAAHVLREDNYFEERVVAFDRSQHTINIGYCAPVPQSVLTPLINSLFEGITISADMSDDKDFLKKIEQRTYQLAVVHEEVTDEKFYCKKCGHEDLFIALTQSDPMTFYPELHLSDLSGLTMLLYSRIGFWMNHTHAKTPDTKYLIQIDRSAFEELARETGYPCFSSSYYLRRGHGVPDRVTVPVKDPECHTDYFLVCLKSEKKRFRKLFDQINEKTIY